MASFTFPWNTVNTLVGDTIDKTLREQVYKSNALLLRLSAKQKSFSGGRTLQIPLVWKTEGNGQWFAGADILDTTIKDTVTMAVCTPKSFDVPISITWDDEKTVQGPTQLKSLLETKLELAKNTAQSLIAQDLYNDGSDFKRMTGLQYIFKDFTGGAPGVLPAQTYLGFARQGRYDGSGGGTQTNNWWIHQGDDTAYTDAANGAGGFDPLTDGQVRSVLGKMWAKIGRAAGSAKVPTLIVSNWGSFTVYGNSLMSQDRRNYPQQDGKLAESGYDNLKYKRATWLVDEYAPLTVASGLEHIYFINEDTLQLRVHEDANFAFEPFRKPHNQMARVGFILWRGEMVCREPRANGVMSSVTITVNA